MPKRADEEALPVACHGCARVESVNDEGYCHACAERRADDPSVFVQGRTLTVSELRMQAEDDEHIAAALDGDTVQEAIKAARSKR
jgi:hypothetical protein